MSWGKRKVSHAKLYRSKRWKALRAKVLREAQYLCAMNDKRKACTVIAIDVDHIRDHQGDKALFYDEKNLQPLCKSCHSSKTLTEQHGRVFDGGLLHDEHGMPLDPDHHWNKG